MIPDRFHYWGLSRGEGVKGGGNRKVIRRDRGEEVRIMSLLLVFFSHGGRSVEGRRVFLNNET